MSAAEVAIEGEEEKGGSEDGAEQEEDVPVVHRGGHEDARGSGDEQRQCGDKGPAPRRLGVLPGVNRGAVGPAEEGEEGGNPDEVVVRGGGGRPGGDGRSGGKDDGDDECTRKPKRLTGTQQRQVDGGEIQHGYGEDAAVFHARGGGHDEDEPGQRSKDDETGDEKGAAVARVKDVALAQIAERRSRAAVKEAIGDVEEPGAEAKDSEGAPGLGSVESAGEAPCPQHGDCGCVEAEEMPVDGKSTRSEERALLGHRFWSWGNQSHSSILEVKTIPHRANDPARSIFVSGRSARHGACASTDDSVRAANS